jgi:hypothetical protein
MITIAFQEIKNKFTVTFTTMGVSGQLYSDARVPLSISIETGQSIGMDLETQLLISGSETRLYIYSLPPEITSSTLKSWIGQRISNTQNIGIFM